MSLKKLNPEIKEALENNNITMLTPFQKAVLPKIKGGADLFCIGDKDAGKTTAIIIATMQKLKSQAFEDAPEH
ncbi:hypothetical protein N7U66_02410 [Lacinutrix neustonica]|uniref:DEAD/DEAH box helicase n=1 Tax=Lacinutrix neustonica TaxID=2980107 RepID=A0A9E8MVV4_9FLAO|nr:hypothetical protein [Lacinutrix neustonica]WAC02572.1 hypothetical protein N7U66_02410 [Lacinutrix neustonica]